MNKCTNQRVLRMPLLIDIKKDILLHQSGHIMLSDFDLAKQSGEPGGHPATVAQIEPNGVGISSFFHFVSPSLYASPIVRNRLLHFLFSACSAHLYHEAFRDETFSASGLPFLSFLLFGPLFLCPSILSVP